MKRSPNCDFITLVTTGWVNNGRLTQSYSEGSRELRARSVSGRGQVNQGPSPAPRAEELVD